MSKKRYIRTHRHRARAQLKNNKAVRKHKRKTGRTGGIWAKKNHSTKLFLLAITIPNQGIWCYQTAQK